ncbi:hypothetical protein MASR2M78_09060 [Treponema sp.]
MRSSKRLIFSLGLSLCLGLAFVSSQSTEVVYFEGDPSLRDGGGRVKALDYDSSVKTGDSILTGQRDIVELAQGKDTSIKIRPNTVFTIREIDKGGQKEQVLTASVGAVAMRFNRLSTKEPRVGSVGTVAGIRGTELTIYAGPDGSALFVVDSGLVSLETAEGTVDLAQNEGVEVSASGIAGEKFSVIGREQDFSSWAEGKTEAFLADPITALEQVQIKMQDFRSGLDEWLAKYQAAKVESDAAVAKMNAISDKAEQEKYRDETWAKLSLQTGNAVLNYRYHALSAFSMRRYVLGPMYVQQRTRNILKPSAEYAAFLKSYTSVLNEYKAVFGPYLDTVDY